jgi:hypothetical protein
MNRIFAFIRRFVCDTITIKIEKTNQVTKVVYATEQTYLFFYIHFK